MIYDFSYVLVLNIIKTIPMTFKFLNIEETDIFFWFYKTGPSNSLYHQVCA